MPIIWQITKPRPERELRQDAIRQLVRDAIAEAGKELIYATAGIKLTKRFPLELAEQTFKKAGKLGVWQKYWAQKDRYIETYIQEHAETGYYRIIEAKDDPPEITDMFVNEQVKRPAVEIERANEMLETLGVVLDNLPENYRVFIPSIKKTMAWLYYVLWYRPLYQRLIYQFLLWVVYTKYNHLIQIYDRNNHRFVELEKPKEKARLLRVMMKRRAPHLHPLLKIATVYEERSDVVRRLVQRQINMYHHIYSTSERITKKTKEQYERAMGTGIPYLFRNGDIYINPVGPFKPIIFSKHPTKIRTNPSFEDYEEIGGKEQTIMKYTHRIAVIPFVVYMRVLYGLPYYEETEMRRQRDELNELEQRVKLARTDEERKDYITRIKELKQRIAEYEKAIKEGYEPPEHIAPTANKEIAQLIEEVKPNPRLPRYHKLFGFFSSVDMAINFWEINGGKIDLEWHIESEPSENWEGTPKEIDLDKIDPAEFLRGIAERIHSNIIKIEEAVKYIIEKAPPKLLEKLEKETERRWRTPEEVRAALIKVVDEAPLQYPIEYTEA